MKKINNFLQLVMISGFVIVVVSVLFAYLNDKGIVKINFLNSKKFLLVILILCTIVMVAAFSQCIFLVIERTKKGYHNFKYCDDDLFAEIDNYTYCYSGNNQYYINLIRIINLYYRKNGEVDKLVKNNQVERLFLRKDFLDNQINMYEEITNLCYSVIISLIIALIGGALTNTNFIVALFAFFCIVGSIFVPFFLRYADRGQGGIYLNQIYKYEIFKLDEKILDLQKALTISNENEKYIHTRQVILKELIRLRKKYKKNKTEIINDISKVEGVDLCLKDRRKICDKEYKINGEKIYIAYRKDSDTNKDFANESFKSIYDILEKYELIDCKK